MITEEPPTMIVDRAGNDGVEECDLDSALAEIREEERTENVRAIHVVPDQASAYARIIKKEAYADALLRLRRTYIYELLPDFVIHKYELFEIDALGCLPACFQHFSP